MSLIGNFSKDEPSNKIVKDSGEIFKDCDKSSDSSIDSTIVKISGFDNIIRCCFFKYITRNQRSLQSHL